MKNRMLVVEAALLLGTITTSNKNKTACLFVTTLHGWTDEYYFLVIRD